MTNANKLTQSELEANETVALIAADKVEGTPVFNADDEKLGSIAKLMIDKRSGQVSYAVMSFGGFLGVGEILHPLPWAALTYDVDRNGYVLNVTREQLESAPQYKDGEEPAWQDDAYGERVYGHYGIPLARTAVI
jgi:hypothetical protein